MSKRILIIEDDIETQFLFSEILESEGHEVVAKSSGKEALTHLNSNPVPDLIFMDLTFPDGTPEEFMTSLRSLPGGTDAAVVLVSGKSDIAEYALRLNARSYIKKPFEIDPLLNLISTIN